MECIDNISGLTKASAEWAGDKGKVGFVPTMGALHNGHISLIKKAREECDKLVVSVFVNPLQFGDGEDLIEYPRDIEYDKALLEKEDVDILFTTTPEEMYPEPFVTKVTADIEWSEVLCGASRPGHFAGVLTVVAKLFNLVRPGVAYFGQKDFQQTVLVKKMAKDLNFPIDIHVCPTIREEDGLAMSSRNVYLSEVERQQAPIIFEALSVGKTMVEAEGVRDQDAVIAGIEQLIMIKDIARIEYLSVVDRNTMRSPNQLSGELVACTSVYFGDTRLIDNVYIDVPVEKN